MCFHKISQLVNDRAIKHRSSNPQIQGSYHETRKDNYIALVFPPSPPRFRADFTVDQGTVFC